MGGVTGGLGPFTSRKSQSLSALTCRLEAPLLQLDTDQGPRADPPTPSRMPHMQCPRSWSSLAVEVRGAHQHIYLAMASWSTRIWKSWRKLSPNEASDPARPNHDHKSVSPETTVCFVIYMLQCQPSSRRCEQQGVGDGVGGGSQRPW